MESNRRRNQRLPGAGFRAYLNLSLGRSAAPRRGGGQTQCSQ